MNYTPEQKACWDRVMHLLEESLGLPSFQAWFKPLSLHAIVGNRMIIIGQNEFSLQHMKNRYGATLLNYLDTVFDRRYELEFYTQEQLREIDLRTADTTLDAKYTFENFVVGPSNHFAYAAALAVAEEPSEAYNPLFIYGGVGLGKTHLMNAIGNYITKASPTARVLLMTSETITNELIDSITKKRTADLRSKLRNVDVLMVDDIQFLSRTKITQEEFFHTFNDLHGSKKQIIISSDRPPRELPEIEERLRSRFAWGLIVDIQKPDYETRVAILRRKASDEGIEAPDEVLQYIAQNVNSNIRELEGSLTSLDAQSRLMGAPITRELAASALNHLVRSQGSHRVTAELIIEVVAGEYGLTPADLTGQRRNREIALPRQIAMYLCHEMTDLSTTAIGQAFGNRDHTTILHGCDKVSSALLRDIAFKRRVEEITKLVEAR